MNDDALADAFARGRLDPRQFGHREHLRLAHIHLRAHRDLALGALHFRAALRRFTHAAGAPGKYHETLTWAYLALVWEASEGAPREDSEAFLARCPALLDHGAGALSEIYDVPAITRDERARRTFVLPRRGGRDG